MTIGTKHHGTVLSTSTSVVPVLQALLKAAPPFDQDKEHFWSIGLTSQLRIKYIDLVTLGSLTEALVRPREVFRMAIHKAVARIIIGHNHPGNSPYPSSHDHILTQKLAAAGDIIDIKVLDHIIITNDTDDFYSMAQNGQI